MVSKNQIKRITSLQQKKFRHALGLFTAEGVKVISELLDSRFELDHLYQTEPLFDKVPESLKTTVNAQDLERMTALHSANNCLAVFKIPAARQPKNEGLIVALDDIRDPGNLGTIIRLCDWFGLTQIVCSLETAELYNPKVIQATMGSLTRVAVHYLDLSAFLSETHLPVFGTFMDGGNIYQTALPQEGVIVLGNEANGISKSVAALAANKISIPRFGDLQKTESLNVAAAAAIILSEFKRHA